MKIDSSKDFALQVLQWGNDIKAHALTGLGFSNEIHVKERYEEFLRIASEMLASINKELRYDPLFAEEIYHFLRSEIQSGIAGYVTPKVCVAAAVFNESGSLLLVKPLGSEGWCLPGGWAEEYCTPAENTQREVQEETNLIVKAQSLLGVFDSRYHPFGTTVTSYTLLFKCKLIGGELKSRIGEVEEVQFFHSETLPFLIPGCRRQVQIAFSNYQDQLTDIYFDIEN